MIDQVVRRGLAHPSTLTYIKRAAQEAPVSMPQWGINLLVASVVAITVFLCLVSLTGTPGLASPTNLTRPTMLSKTS